MKAYAFDGLKRQPTWEELVRDVSRGGVPDVDLPDRAATYNALMNPFVSAWEDQQRALIASQRSQQDYWLNRPQEAPHGVKRAFEDDFKSAVSEDLGDLHDRVQAARMRDWAAHANGPERYDISSDIAPDEPMQDAAAQEGVDLGRPFEVQDQGSGGGEILGLRPTGWAAGAAGGLAGAAGSAGVIGLRVARNVQAAAMAGEGVAEIAAGAPYMAGLAALGGGVLEELSMASSGARIGSAFGPMGAVAGSIAGATVGAAGLAVGAEAAFHNRGSWMGGGSVDALRHILRPEDRNAPAPLRDFTSSNIRAPDGRSAAAASAAGYAAASDFDALRAQVPGDGASGLGRSAPRRNRRP